MSARLAYLDTLKLFLTILVVVHHVAITYGASGSWFYVEPTSSVLARAVGTLFTTTNQFFFMGLFFFLSGYFTPAALERKGRAHFLRDRLVRLGIPLGLFMLLGAPYVEHISSLRDETPTKGYWDQLLEFARRGDFPPGPLWFVETLLVFSAAYGLFARPAQDPAPPRRPVGHAHLFALAGLLAVGEFAIRLLSPAGHEWRHLQLAFFPQYGILFVLGTMAPARGWLMLDRRLLRVWVPVLAAIAAILSGTIFTLLPKGPAAITPWLGGMHVEAFALSVLESLYCVGACVTAIVVFRDHSSALPPKWLDALADNAYAVYVLHAPVIVAVAVALRGVPVNGLIKFFVVTAAGLSSCFALSHFVLRRSALVRRVL